MFNRILTLLFSVLLLFACSKKDNKEIVSQPSPEEQVVAIYKDAVDSLKKGDAY